MIIIDPRSRTPIFEQIKEQIINLINIGELKPHDKLPSIRQLASDLELNVNTVKRAFQELESERVTYSLPGKGVFISENAVTDLPLPDSPTIPNTFPRSKLKETPFTARTSPASVKKEVCKLFTSNKAIYKHPFLTHSVSDRMHHANHHQQS